MQAFIINLILAKLRLRERVLKGVKILYSLLQPLDRVGYFDSLPVVQGFVSMYVD
jgi:hypothetical protein